MESILFVSRRGDPRGRRRSAMLSHRASRLTKRAAAAAKPEEAGGFAPMPSASGSAVPTGTPFAKTLGLVANPSRQNASI